MFNRLYLFPYHETKYGPKVAKYELLFFPTSKFFNHSNRHQRRVRSEKMHQIVIEFVLDRFLLRTASEMRRPISN